MNSAALHYHATKVRRALEQAARSGDAALAYFPRAACGLASEVLAFYLRTRPDAPQQLTIVRASRGRHSHAWVEADGWAVDVTRDQDDGEPVMVGDPADWRARYPDDTRVVRAPATLEEMACGDLAHYRAWDLLEALP